MKEKELEEEIKKLLEKEEAKLKANPLFQEAREFVAVYKKDILNQVKKRLMGSHQKKKVRRRNNEN